MKKNLFLIIALFVATSMSAQFYIGAKVGYGIGTQRTAPDVTLTDNSKTNNWVSLGQGVTPGLKLGYFFNDNFGVELQMNYFLGSTATVADYDYTAAPGVTVKAIGEAQSTQFRLLPAFVYRFDNGLYGRFGVVIPVSGKTLVTTNTTITSPAGTSVTDEETEYHGKFAWGFAGALGYHFKLNDNMGLFGEVEYVALTIRSNTSEITMSTTDGVDNLAGMDVIDYQTNYLDELDASSNNGTYNTSVDKTQPLDDLATSKGYSSVRFNVGFTMSF